MKQEIQTNLLKVFIENARLVPESEQSDLPGEKFEAVSEKTGRWIEVVCSEGCCSLEKDKISLPAGGVIPEETKGIWLSLFCPDNQCLNKQSTVLP